MHLAFTKRSLFLFFLLVLNFNSKAERKDLDSLFKLGFAHFENYNNEWGYKVLEQLDQLIDQNTIDANLFDYYRLKAIALDRKEIYKAQRETLNKTLLIAQKLNDPSKIGQAYIEFASYYEKFDEWNNAIPYILKALDEFIILGNKSQIAYLYNKLGLVYYADENYRKALTYFFASFVLFNQVKHESVQNAYWVQNCLANMGLCYKQLGLTRKALAYLKIALEYCKTAPFNRTRPIAVIKTNIGVMYGELNMVKPAFAYLTEGVEECLKPENQEIAHGVESLIYLANLHSLTGDQKTSGLLFEKARKYIDLYKIYELEDIYLSYFAKFNSRWGNFKTAYFSVEKYQHIKDSTDMLDGKSTFSKQILVHTLEKERIENELLTKQNDYQKLLNNAVIALAIIISLFLAFGLYNLRLSKAKTRKLESLNKQITNQKYSLEELNEKLHLSSQNKSYLIQTIAHDLRTPIGNLISLTNLLEEHVAKNPESEEYLRLISSSCFMSLHIIEDILDQSVIERGKLKLALSKVQINPIIKDCISLLKFRYEPKQMQIVSYFEQETEIEIDAERIKRVLVNILINAIKFSPRKSVIHVHQFLRDNYCIISIEDQGIGMDKDMISKIFDKNSAAGREGLENEKSFGIGLSITRSIIEEHGGKINVESQPNYGSTFYIELPIKNLS